MGIKNEVRQFKGHLKSLKKSVKDMKKKPPGMTEDTEINVGGTNFTISPKGKKVDNHLSWKFREVMDKFDLLERMHDAAPKSPRESRLDIEKMIKKNILKGDKIIKPVVEKQDVTRNLPSSLLERLESTLPPPLPDKESKSKYKSWESVRRDVQKEFYHNYHEDLPPALPVDVFADRLEENLEDIDQLFEDFDMEERNIRDFYARSKSNH